MWCGHVVIIHVVVGLICAKDHHNKHVQKQEQKKESVPRFTIPHPNHPESAFIPEAIGQSVGNQRGQIVGTELPGAYGEDYDMEPGSESGSGVVSGSGSGSEKDTESPEAPGKYGTNLVHNPPPSNPSAAFVGNTESGADEDEEKEEADQGKELDKQEDNKQEEKKEEEVTAPPAAPPPKAETPKKVQQSEKSKSTRKVEKHKAKAEKSSKVVKKKTKVKAKDHDDINMISKIDAIAKQIERVEHREKLDRKEAATLKVAKKVAKKVIKTINAKKKHKKIRKKLSRKLFEEIAAEEEEKSERMVRPAPTHKKETSAVAAPPKGPEGFECPWACFWTCHSYCPKECCNNPYKCDLGCREFCTPYCSDRCCAPGSQRLPKLQINFDGTEGDERKNISAIFAEDDKHQMFRNSSISSSSSSNARVSPAMKEEEDAKLHTRLDPAENSYQQLKEQEHQIALANQIEALKKATSYAAQLMGLPPECPLACARICLPGLCKQQCCTRSRVPGIPIVPTGVSAGVQAFQGASPLTLHSSANFNPGSLSMPGADPAPIVPGPPVTPSRNQLALANQFALARKQQYLMAHNGLYGPNAAAAAASAFHSAYPAAAANNYMMNKLAFQSRLLEGKNDFVPALARYRALQYANRQKLLLRNNLESQASRQQIADATQRCHPAYPSTCQPPAAAAAAAAVAPPSWLHNCPPICRSSCIPQCPNECCLHSPRANGGAASM